MIDQNRTEDVQVSPPNISEKLTEEQSTNLLGLPNELLFRIISLLSMTCIRNLVINQRLRPICEQCLYKKISLSGQTRRSLRLLETFAGRPDLALLVRHLEIDVSWFNKWEGWNEEMLHILSPDGMDALALARNIVSLRVSGDSNWTHARTAEATRLRETISKMKLVHLEIDVPSKRDPSRSICVIPGSFRGLDLGPDILAILRAQPLLEGFAYSELLIRSKTPGSVESYIQDSDISNLKSLTARPAMAAVFLPAARRVESLSLTGWWGFRIMRKLEGLPAPRRASIQNLTMSARKNEEEVWLNLPRILALFPNVQKLNVGIIVFEKVLSEAKQFFNQVTEAIRVLSRLRQLEVCYEARNPQFNVDIELELEEIMECKTRCPQLETLIDPEGRLWEFEADASTGPAGEGHGPRLIGRLEARAKGFAEDLPGPKRG